MTNVNLSEKTGSLAHALRTNYDAINAHLTDNSTVAQMKLFVRDIIMNVSNKDALHKSPGTKRFMTALDKQRDKVSIALLVSNTILAGDNLSVI